jgi:hypothetical protein
MHISPSQSGREHAGTYALNRAETTKFSLEILLVCLVAKSRHNHRLESITTNIWVFVRLIWEFVSTSVSKSHISIE